MKLTKIMLLTTVVTFNSCGTGEKKKEESRERIQINTEKKEEILPTVTVNNSVLKGFWKYTEVRVNPLTEGKAPVGEILLGINDKNQMAFATNGIEELKSNLKSMPTSFKIVNSTLIPLEKIDEADFKISFNNTSTQVFLVNEEELVLGKGVIGGNRPVIYMYFKKYKQ